MSPELIDTLLTQGPFALFAFWLMVRMEKRSDETTKSIMSMSEKVTEAINNNTQALIKLTTLVELGRKGGGNAD